MESSKTNKSLIPRNTTKIWSPSELETIKATTKWISISNKVYDVTDWMDKHPGGDLVLEHYLYKDATIQTAKMHSTKANRYLSLFQIGVLEKPLYEENEVMKGFRKLEEELIADGLFEPTKFFYSLEALKGLGSLILGILLVLYANQTYLTVVLEGVVFAFCWHQMSFVAHDAGHNGVSGNFKFDHYLGVFLASLMSGLSIGWWKDSHNVHHLVTNEPEHDPDIQHLPFLAISERFFDGVHSTYHNKRFEVDKAASIILRVQHYLYYVFLFFGRANLYVQSVKFVLLNKRAKYRYAEGLALILFAFWFSLMVSVIPGWQKKLLFITLANGLTFILHVQITLSHFAMSTEKVPEENFVLQQLRTTMDVDCSEWLDWFHGGLQFQVIHHLFPMMPRHNLRTARKKAMIFFKEHNLNYQCYEFAIGNIIVLSHLKKIADLVGKYRKKDLKSKSD